MQSEINVYLRLCIQKLEVKQSESNVQLTLRLSIQTLCSFESMQLKTYAYVCSFEVMDSKHVFSWGQAMFIWGYAIKHYVNLSQCSVNKSNDIMNLQSVEIMQSDFEFCLFEFIQ